MTFDSKPTYADLAAIAPIKVRRLPVTVTAMYFSGGAAQATSIIDWILLNDGTASWSEAYEPFTATDPTEPEYEVLIPGQPEHISIRTPGGTLRAVVGSWVIQDVDGEFYVCDPSTFRQTHGHV